MGTVAESLNRAARQCSVTPPDNWASATQPTHVEFRDDFLTDTIRDLRDRVELPQPLSKTVTINGDGSENYDLPSDFYRLARDSYAVYERTATRRRAYPVTSDGDYEYMKELGSAGAYRFYRLRGYPGAYTIDFYRALESGTVAVVSYVSTVWCAESVGGAEKSDFTTETDVLLLPANVVERGIIWRFRERRGLPFADAYNAYEALVTRLSNDGRQRKVISFDDDAGTPHDKLLWPPVPDFIPSS